MKLKYILILFFSFLLYYLIIYLIQIGLLFHDDSHVRGFYVVFFPYYFVLFFMSLFYRYKILTLFLALPISFLVWKINNFLISNSPGSIQVDILLVISVILLIIINELLFLIKKKSPTGARLSTPLVLDCIEYLLKLKSKS